MLVNDGCILCRRSDETRRFGSGSGCGCGGLWAGGGQLAAVIQPVAYRECLFDLVLSLRSTHQVPLFGIALPCSSSFLTYQSIAPFILDCWIWLLIVQRRNTSLKLLYLVSELLFPFPATFYPYPSTFLHPCISRLVAGNKSWRQCFSESI